MIAKCANPKCVREFRYLHEGRVFLLEIQMTNRNLFDPDTQVKPEFFWLCDQCVSQMTVVTSAGVAQLRERKKIQDERKEKVPAIADLREAAEELEYA